MYATLMAAWNSDLEYEKRAAAKIAPQLPSDYLRIICFSSLSPVMAAAVMALAIAVVVG